MTSILKFNLYYAQILQTLTINFNGKFFRGHIHFLKKYAEFDRAIKKVDKSISSSAQVETFRSLFLSIFDQIYGTKLFAKALHEFIEQNEHIDENLNICFQLTRNIRSIDRQQEHNKIADAYFSADKYNLFAQILNCVAKSM